MTRHHKLDEVVVHKDYLAQQRSKIAKQQSEIERLKTDRDRWRRDSELLQEKLEQLQDDFGDNIHVTSRHSCWESKPEDIEKRLASIEAWNEDHRERIDQFTASAFRVDELQNRIEELEEKTKLTREERIKYERAVYIHERLDKQDKRLKDLENDSQAFVIFTSTLTNKEKYSTLTNKEKYSLQYTNKKKKT